jgi:ATP-dependent 26S proteasome regulatory subunit
MDEALEFPLPGLEERRRILQIYLDSYISKAGTAEGVAVAFLLSQNSLPPLS